MLLPEDPGSFDLVAGLLAVAAAGAALFRLLAASVVALAARNVGFGKLVAFDLDAATAPERCALTFPAATAPLSASDVAGGIAVSKRAASGSGSASLTTSDGEWSLRGPPTGGALPLP